VGLALATSVSELQWTGQVIDAMNLDSGVPLAVLKVDGGVTKSELCMQRQADVLSITVGAS